MGSSVHLCFELQHQSRRATNTDMILVTEEGEEVTAHQAVLCLNSRLLRTLLQNVEAPKLILCGVTKKVLEAFMSLLYCGEVSLDRSVAENLTDLLWRLEVDTKHLSFPKFKIQSQATSKGLDEKETNTSEAEDVKFETDSFVSEDDVDFVKENHEDDSGNEIDDLKDSKWEEDCNVDENFYRNSVGTIKPDLPGKVSVHTLNGPKVKMGGLKKIHWNKKKEEEIQQGIRYASGQKKRPHKKREIPQKAKRGKFICPDCGIVVTMQRTLTKHLQSIHQGIRYPCDQCPYQAISKMRLKDHIESVHEGKRYFCDQCEHVAPTKYYLKAHITNTHCERNFHCDQCDFKAKTAATLKAHVLAIHLKIKFTCPECGSKFCQRGHLAKHRKLKHGYKPKEYNTQKKLAMMATKLE